MGKTSTAQAEHQPYGENINRTGETSTGSEKAGRGQSFYQDFSPSAAFPYAFVSTLSD
ncbi:hypothetical protein [Virgibacillus ihumii]|uniref:hypothetical protein n=1 Tax=Virgibacillus ihumii TaxID=2686091 RepID=UPI00157D7EEF|nr:hypothetical protein [Virgibacillus ihumii]